MSLVPKICVSYMLAQFPLLAEKVALERVVLASVEMLLSSGRSWPFQQSQAITMLELTGDDEESLSPLSQPWLHLSPDC